jgi:hypothetical protein
MLKKITSSFFYCIVLISVGCNQGVKNKKIVYVAISDSSYRHDSSYEQSFRQWKKVYEECMNYQLFPNAIYMGLQEKVSVGSINNKLAQNVNAGISVLDTTYSKNLFNLFSVIGTSNCYSKINLNKNLQNEFYSELKRVLNQLKQYQYLNDLIDTTQMTFRITTLLDNSILPDSLVSMLQRTKDTSLLHFKELLLTPGNALLIHDAMIFGFIGEFPVRKKLPAIDEKKFNDEVFFNFGNRDETGSIKLLPNYHLKVSINKYYTVFGEFYVFKEVEN